MKRRNSVLQKSNSNLVFRADTWKKSLNWLTPQYEQHAIKFISIYCYAILNQVSGARNILVSSVTAKSFKAQC